MSSGNKGPRKFGFHEVILSVATLTPITCIALNAAHVINVPDAILGTSTITFLGIVVSQCMQHLKESRPAGNSTLVGPVPPHTEILKKPQSKSEYESLWGGFTGVYHAYNPKYFLENIPETEWNEVLSTFERRFAEPTFRKAVYIFLTGDEEGRKHLEVFNSKLLSLPCFERSISEKLEIIELRDRCSSQEPSLYLGTREGSQIAIIEMGDSLLPPSPTPGASGAPFYQGASEWYLLHKEEKGQVGGYFAWLKGRLDRLLVTRRK